MKYFLNDHFLTFSLKCLKEIKNWPQARFEPAISRKLSECPNHWTTLTCTTGCHFQYIFMHGPV